MDNNIKKKCNGCKRILTISQFYKGKVECVYIRLE